MEGLIPFVYRAIVQYKNGKQGPIDSWFNESPSYAYIRLPGHDSGRFQASDTQILGSDIGFSSSSAPTSTTDSVIISSTSSVRSPVCPMNSRQVATT
ncbi:Legume-specific protein [Quillaja saponaria]|uniref:Legume-specific protein n=1 Tax=Quillaja saponaria TaxID=32244 RepID=A0AAD7PN66_QUISA|nr:Legume-specific protein [Quillaja saponaria]